MGIFGPGAPARLRELRTAGQRTPAELIDRYHLACQPIRDLLVEYLRERQPALDYSSLEQLARHAGQLFWADLEAHHPGIDSLQLPAGVAVAWKQRLRTKTRRPSAPAGGKSEVGVPRINHRECLTPVRAFYLDLAHWAVEDPARWGQWAVPCPVGQAEIIPAQGQAAPQVPDGRPDPGTAARPARPGRAPSGGRRRSPATAGSGPQPARRGVHRRRADAGPLRGHQSSPGKVWAHDPASGKRRNLTDEEEHAFWAFATVEVLRATGIRIEELTELSHHSLIQYRLPATGELVPLLQIAPSKTDAERLLVVSPELADVLAAIICRIRGPAGAIPLVAAYDARERVWLPPMPAAVPAARRRRAPGDRRRTRPRLLTRRSPDRR